MFLSISTSPIDQKALGEVTIDELRNYLDENQFAKGSMLPKVQAAIDFVENTNGGKAVITSLENIDGFLANGDGTIISKSVVDAAK